MESQESAADILAERDALRVEVSDLREDVLELNNLVMAQREGLKAWREVGQHLVSEGTPLVAALSLIGSLAGEAERSGRGSNHSSPASPAGEA